MPATMGFFGKLPGYGDFVERNLPQSFIDHWDAWLQQSLASSQQWLGDQWLDYYLTAPIYHFALSPGCVDERCWLGLWIPSVDRVGRYFPLTLVQPFEDDIFLGAMLLNNEDWFQELDQIALACINESPTVEAMAEVIQSLQQPQSHPWQISTTDSSFNAHDQRITSIVASEPDRQGTSMMEMLLRQQYNAFSLWCSRSSEYRPSVFFASKCLPNPEAFTAVLQGQWRQADECGNSVDSGSTELT